ncbi:MAG: alpha/beta fold hydrolase [Solirubrobacterales bacterium]
MIAHSRAGEGEPLVLLHGLGATGAIWEPVSGRVAQQRDVISIDLPGFGRSEPLPEGVRANPANLAAAVAGLCERLGMARPHVAGNSLGAWVGLEMARAGRAASVTAISPAGLWGRPLGPRSFDSHALAVRLRPLISLLLWSRRGRHAMLRTTVAWPDRVPARAGRALVLSWIDAPGYDAANHEMRSDIFDPEGFPDVPVTLAWAEHDRLVSPPRPKQYPPGARYLVLPGVGHTPTWDDPGLIAGLLLEGSSVGALAP